MAETLESPDREFKITINNMLRVLMVKVDNILERMGNASREMTMSRKIQKATLEKTWRETSKNEMQREKKEWKNRAEYLKTEGQLQIL